MKLGPIVFLAVSWLLGVSRWGCAQAGEGPSLELTRAARPWEFASAVGTRAGLLGDEGGSFEAWVYPLKLLRNFHLRFKVDGETIEGRALARSIRVRPESTTITYAWDTFSVRETWFVPVHEPGAFIQLEIDNAQPFELEAVFERDFQLEWPGTMGASGIDWNPALHAFSLGEDQQKFSALIGSPSATDFHSEYVTNYTAGKDNSLGFGVIPPGRTTKLIVMAASFQGLPPVEQTYKKLSSSYSQLLADSASYYQDYLNSHVSLDLPDRALQQAYEWAQISVLQGLVVNPFLGEGLVAGYRESGEDQRPGYAWFFGRDALWTSLALDAEGDFATTRTALEFLGKYQRADGKVPHEIAQGASFVPWFQSMPYAYASADATPLYIAAMDDYVKRSGDAAFAQEKWDNLWRAYKFMVSTYDGNGFPQNMGIGHGWVEGGPLLPVRSELYQTAVAAEALRSLADLAHRLGREESSRTLAAEFDHLRTAMNRTFWNPEKDRYAFGLDNQGKQLTATSVLSTVPMWFGLLDEPKGAAMIAQLKSPTIQTDWGMRIISSSDPKYDAAGYHSGTVWPLFTGWASVGEYRYHEPMAAYANLRSNALLTFDGSLGHVTEVLSGSYYQTLATGSPSQVWSSAMVIAPILTGLLGIDTDASSGHLTFSPHVPADWTTLAVKNVAAGACKFNLGYGRTVGRINLVVERISGSHCSMDFSPGLSLRPQVTEVALNGHDFPFEMRKSVQDQHVAVHLDMTEKRETVSIRLKNDFDLGNTFGLPALGSPDLGVRVISEVWGPNNDTLTLKLASASSGTYDLNVWNPEQITSVDGGDLLNIEPTNAKLRVTLSSGQTGESSERTLVLHFDGKPRHKSATTNNETSAKDGHDAN